MHIFLKINHYLFHLECSICDVNNKHLLLFSGSMQSWKAALQVFSPTSTFERSTPDQWTQSLSLEECSDATNGLHEPAFSGRSRTISFNCKLFYHLTQWFDTVHISNLILWINTLKKLCCVIIFLALWRIRHNDYEWNNWLRYKVYWILIVL